MPQMSPMNWLMIFTSNTMIMTLIMLTVYHFLSYKPLKKSNYPFLTLIWKW